KFSTDNNYLTINYKYSDIDLLTKITDNLFNTIVDAYDSEIEVVATTSDRGFSNLRLRRVFQSYIEPISYANKVCSKRDFLSF
ncbi:MAG: hypothetical protein AAFQ41_11610, partial [Cyanobacteria bacterium J06623_7]